MLEQWGVPLAVLGMVVATLLMAALVTRYQAHQSLVRTRVRQVEHRLLGIVNALHELRTVPFSRELRVTLRSEILARYRCIRKLYRGYPEIADKIAKAEAALDAEGGPTAGSVGKIENEQVFFRMTGAFHELIDLMERGDTLQPIPGDVRGIFHRELGERRAEMYSRYHLVEAGRQQKLNNLVGARSHVSSLLLLLRQQGPPTEFVRELQAEAGRVQAQIAARAAGVDPGTDADGRATAVLADGRGT